MWTATTFRRSRKWHTPVSHALIFICRSSISTYGTVLFILVVQYVHLHVYVHVHFRNSALVWCAWVGQIDASHTNEHFATIFSLL